MKTILINVFDYAVLKNVFMPQFSDALRAARVDVRCIVLVPSAKLREFSETLAPLGFETAARPQKLATFWENAALFAARNVIPTHSVRQIQEEGIDGSGRLSVGKYVVARILWRLGHSHAFRSFLKKLLVSVFDESVFDDVLGTHRPDLVVATSTYAVDDIRLLRAAKRRGIRTLGMIKSWDNLSSKDALLVPPDRLVVHNEVVAQEAMALHRYPKEKISIIGVPQFDWYADPSIPYSREDFFMRMGLDPQKKLITYTAMGLWLVRHERDIIRMLYRIVIEGKLARPAQLLVRLHPAYPDEKRALEKEFPGLTVDQPGSPAGASKDAWKADWRFSAEDVRQLASTLLYSDVILNCGSTIILDAACFRTPIIGIAFDGDAAEGSYWRSSVRLFEREHCKKVLKTGGVRIVRNRQGLKDALNVYLIDSSRDRVSRENIVRQQAGEIGHASEKLARTMIEAANSV